MIYSITDIGTNSVRFMLAEYSSDKTNLIYTSKTTTRLGEGLYTAEKMLCDRPISDTLCAVKKYVDYSKEHGADSIICIATSAVRDAGNSTEFARAIKDKTGITLRILSGEEEAYAGFMGAVGDMSNSADTVLVDIGGGSTEIVQNTANRISGISFECGCVRLKELFGNDYTSAYKYISDTIELPLCDNIVWIGGTATAVAMLYKNVDEYSRDSVHMTDIPVDYIKALRDTVLALPKEKLAGICGFDVRRGEILPYGLMIMCYIIEMTGAKHITVSEKGLMDGVILLNEQGRL